jgi:hypothetical protein
MEVSPEFENEKEKENEKENEKEKENEVCVEVGVGVTITVTVGVGVEVETLATVQSKLRKLTIPLLKSHRTVFIVPFQFTRRHPIAVESSSWFKCVVHPYANVYVRTLRRPK